MFQDGKKKSYINELIACRLKTHITVVAKAYALPKVYKPGLNWRLIVSTIGSPTYNLAKYLTNILKPILGNTESFIENN